MLRKKKKKGSRDPDNPYRTGQSVEQMRSPAARSLRNAGGPL